MENIDSDHSSIIQYLKTNNIIVNNKFNFKLMENLLFDNEKNTIINKIKNLNYNNESLILLNKINDMISNMNNNEINTNNNEINNDINNGKVNNMNINNEIINIHNEINMNDNEIHNDVNINNDTMINTNDIDDINDDIMNINNEINMNDNEIHNDDANEINLHKIPKYEYENVKNKCYKKFNGKNSTYNFALSKFINELKLYNTNFNFTNFKKYCKDHFNITGWFTNDKQLNNRVFENKYFIDAFFE